MLHIIALGANLGATPSANARRLRRAAMVLARGAGQARLSRLFLTPAHPPGAGGAFVNAVLRLEVPVGPERMLRRLHALEARHGRVRGARWTARILDLDLIASGALVRPAAETQRDWRRLSTARQALETPDRLILPHPRMQDRAFVLIPLCDVAPRWRHPLTGRTARAMRDALPPKARRGVRPI
jgi:2-amino-4-hydroxy-6-hydroxymethyldihydropteridine diphosphokinase